MIRRNDEDERISLSDLHGTKLIWEDSDGNKQESEIFTCSDKDCEICQE